MSILLLVMSLLALFHFFYQSVIVKTNFGLYENDLRLKQHKLEIYEIRKQNNLNQSEREFLEETKEVLHAYHYIPRELTVIDLIRDISSRNQTERKESLQKTRMRKLSSDELFNIYASASKDMIRCLASNGSVFLFFLSPIIFLVMLYGIIAGKPISLEDQLEKMSSKHC